jgi:hypothetical protein
MTYGSYDVRFYIKFYATMCGRIRWGTLIIMQVFAAGQALWRLNNEYRKRLAHAQTCVALLDEILTLYDPYEPALELMRYMRDQLAVLTEEHRSWRYECYYVSPQSKRMVQEERAVSRAVARFNRMRSDHEPRLYALYDLLESTPPPNTTFTRIPNGNLWQKLADAVHELMSFRDYVNTLERMH